MVKFLVFGAVLTLLLTFRFLTFDAGPGAQIPEGEVIFEATIKQEPRITDKWQVIRFGAIKIYAGHWPKFTAGERVRVEGEVKEGKMFYPEITKVIKEPFEAQGKPNGPGVLV